MRFVGWILVIGIIVGILVLNASRSSVNSTYNPPPGTYSPGTVCFDDGAGGISNPDECLP